ncbi:MAG: UDP-N-acetylmuramate dehydrogenase [Oscillospiraceae bacterium]|jgi:UDP-N-acetylmuramate dehydrogenase|nr:UDP-N-acetylmuramate dehydrogenase [Oscillospiraceae bacterium]
MDFLRVAELAVSDVSRDTDAEVRFDEPMSAHTSFRIGGAVFAMILPRTVDSLTRVIGILRGHGIEPLIVGRGTNLLVADTTLDRIAVKTTGVDAELVVSDDSNVVTAPCGITLARLATVAAEHGLAGLEFAHGIPGSLGGAIFMNAGAYGGEMGGIVRRVTSVDVAGAIHVRTHDECGFAYRHSAFADTGEIILSAELELTYGDRDAILERMTELMRRRRESQPLEYPSAGSAFKRPADGYAAELIDRCGLRGYRVGGAVVSDKHAGFVVNVDNATFSDVLSVLDHVRETVLRETGTELEPEIRIIK